MQIFRQIKSIESISVNSSHTLSVFYTSGGKIYIIDNITRGIVAKIDFGELILANDGVSKQLVPNLEELIEKERSKLLDAVEFCKNNKFLVIASLKLSNLFLIRIDYDPLGRTENNHIEIVLLRELLAENVKNKTVKLSPDPFSKYNICLSGYNPGVINLKMGKPSSFKSFLANVKEQVMDVEVDVVKDPEGSNTSMKDMNGEGFEESQFIFANFLDRHCSKEIKEVLVVQKNLIVIVKFRYEKLTREFSNFQLAARFVISVTFQLHNMQLSQSTQFFALKHQKKSLKVFEYNNGVINSVRDFEVICFTYLFFLILILLRLMKAGTGKILHLVCIKTKKE